MKPLGRLEIGIYSAALTLLLGGSFLSMRGFYHLHCVPKDFAGVSSVLVFFASFIGIAILGSALIARIFPMRDGRYSAEEQAGFEFVMWKLYGFLNLFSLTALVHTELLVFPFRWPLYRMLGARVGSNVMLCGRIYDPMLVTVGDNVILGAECLISGHAVMGDHAYLGHITIGDGATIGARTIIGFGTRVGAGAVIGAASVVTKYTVIPPGEIWAGSPARRVRSLAATNSEAVAPNAKPQLALIRVQS